MIIIMEIREYRIFYRSNRAYQGFKASWWYLGIMKASSEDKALGNFLAELEMKGKSSALLIKDIELQKIELKAREVYRWEKGV